MRTILEMFRPPSAKQLAQRELEDAQRELLRSQSALDGACASVSYNQARVKRLTSILGAAV